MRFYTITPKTFVLRSEDEKIRLQKYLKKMGLSLSPLSKEKAIDLWSEDSQSNSQDTEPYSDSQQSADELAHDSPAQRPHPLAGSYGG